jgi:hypothetical protein
MAASIIRNPEPEPEPAAGARVCCTCTCCSPVPGGGDEPCGALGGNDRDGLGASAHRNKLDTTLVTRSQQTTPCNPPASTAQHSTAQHSTARYSHCCPPNAARAAPSPRPPQSNGGAARPRIERVSAGPST